MTHDEIVAEIQARAAARGVLSHYCGRAARCAGGPGLPDLLLVGTAGLAWVEVKTPGDKLSKDQTRWKWALRAIGEIHEVMGESDLAEGHAVDELLNFVGTSRVAA